MERWRADKQLRWIPCQAGFEMSAHGSMTATLSLFSHPWTGVNDCSFVLVQSSMNMSDKVTLWRVYKPCLTGDSPQLLANSPPLHISPSTKFSFLPKSLNFDMYADQMALFSDIESLQGYKQILYLSYFYTFTYSSFRQWQPDDDGSATFPKCFSTDTWCWSNSTFLEHWKSSRL